MRLPRYTPSLLDAHQHALYTTITTGPRAHGPQHFALTTEDGALTGPFNAFLASPEVGEAVQELGSAIRYRSSLSHRHREIAILVVAATHNCRFEQHAHEAVARSIGITEAELAALRSRDFAHLADADRQLAVLAAALLAGDLDEEQWDTAETLLGPAGVFDLTTLVGYYSLLALQLRVFRVD